MTARERYTGEEKRKVSKKKKSLHFKFPDRSY